MVSLNWTLLEIMPKIEKIGIEIIPELKYFLYKIDYAFESGL